MMKNESEKVMVTKVDYNHVFVHKKFALNENITNGVKNDKSFTSRPSGL